MYHCQLCHAPRKVKGLHLLADIIILCLNIGTLEVNIKNIFTLTDRNIYHLQTYIFKYIFLHLLHFTALPFNCIPRVSFRNYEMQTACSRRCSLKIGSFASLNLPGCRVHLVLPLGFVILWFILY